MLRRTTVVIYVVFLAHFDALEIQRGIQSQVRPNETLMLASILAEQSKNTGSSRLLLEHRADLLDPADVPDLMVAPEVFDRRVGQPYKKSTAVRMMGVVQNAIIDLYSYVTLGKGKSISVLKFAPLPSMDSGMSAAFLFLFLIVTFLVWSLVGPLLLLPPVNTRGGQAPQSINTNTRHGQRKHEQMNEERRLSQEAVCHPREETHAMGSELAHGDAALKTATTEFDALKDFQQHRQSVSQTASAHHPTYASKPPLVVLLPSQQAHASSMMTPSQQKQASSMMAVSRNIGNPMVGSLNVRCATQRPASPSPPRAGVLPSLTLNRAASASPPRAGSAAYGCIRSCATTPPHTLSPLLPARRAVSPPQAGSVRWSCPVPPLARPPTHALNPGLPAQRSASPSPSQVGSVRWSRPVSPRSSPPAHVLNTGLPPRRAGFPSPPQAGSVRCSRPVSSRATLPTYSLNPGVQPRRAASPSPSRVGSVRWSRPISPQAAPATHVLNPGLPPRQTEFSSPPQAGSVRWVRPVSPRAALPPQVLNPGLSMRRAASPSLPLAGSVRLDYPART